MKQQSATQTLKTLNCQRKPATKAKLLLYAHFHRRPLTLDLQNDLQAMLDITLPLVFALVDVISSVGSLKQAIMAMEISQMLVQATMHNSSPLMQLPFFTDELAEKAKDFAHKNDEEEEVE